MRRVAMVVLSMGVILGFGSGFARIAHARHGCHDEWRRDWHGQRGWEHSAPMGPAAPVVVQAPAVAAAPPQVIQAPAPQIYIVMPSGSVVPAVKAAE